MKKKVFIIISIIWFNSFSQEVKLGDGSALSPEPILEVPVVFHLVGNQEILNKYNQEYFSKLLNIVNDRLKLDIKDLIDDRFEKDVAKLNIKLVEPDVDNSCSPVKFVSKYLSSKEVFYLFKDEYILKFNSEFDSKNYLNIWVCNTSLVDFNFKLPIFPSLCLRTPFKLIKDEDLENIVGYVPNKKVLDGIILDVEDLDDFSLDPFMLIHELGHYFGLEHIWGYDWECLTDDGISDTPPQRKFHKKNEYTKPQVSCNGRDVTNHQNFMDYSYNVGMFTHKQKEVIRNYITLKKPGFLKKSKCIVKSKSVLSKIKKRTKFGTRMIVNHLYSFGTITDRSMVELFNSIGIVPTEANMKKMGLEIVANDKFKDIATGEFVNQHQIYERLDLKKAKAIYKSKSNLSGSLNNNISTPIMGYGEICFTNPNYYSRRAVLTNKKTGKRFEVLISKSGYNYGDKKTTCSTKIPFGIYKCDIYTSFTNKQIRTINKVLISKIKREHIELNKNGYN